jgi:hypothetical protein
MGRKWNYNFNVEVKLINRLSVSIMYQRTKLNVLHLVI